MRTATATTTATTATTARTTATATVTTTTTYRPRAFPSSPTIRIRTTSRCDPGRRRRRLAAPAFAIFHRQPQRPLGEEVARRLV